MNLQLQSVITRDSRTGSLVIYMRAQNAALIMDRDDHSNVSFHTFEVSPRAHEVMTALFVPSLAAR